MSFRHDAAESLFLKIDNMVNNMPQGYSSEMAQDLERLASAYADLAEWAPAIGYSNEENDKQNDSFGTLLS